MVNHFDGDSTVLGFVEGAAGVAVEGRRGSLSRRHKATEKTSRPERRRPRRHHRLSAMTLRKLRETQCVKIRCQFLRLLDSSASLPIRIPAWICMSLGLQRWVCSMQGGDLRGASQESIPEVNHSMG